MCDGRSGWENSAIRIDDERFSPNSSGQKEALFLWMSVCGKERKIHHATHAELAQPKNGQRVEKTEIMTDISSGSLRFYSLFRSSPLLLDFNVVVGRSATASNGNSLDSSLTWLTNAPSRSVSSPNLLLNRAGPLPFLWFPSPPPFVASRGKCTVSFEWGRSARWDGNE